jgi:hypothetical protein
MPRTLSEAALKHRGKTLVAIYLGICLSVLIFLMGALVAAWTHECSDYLFSARWCLDELETLFTGPLPADAADIHYDNGPVYALLSFKAPPESANEFANRFCAGFLYQGYDPFNTQDNVSGDIGHLVQTQEDMFYYSSSPDSSRTLYGNRCFDLARGGLNQILVDRTLPETYTIKLEISGGCNSRARPYPCSVPPTDYPNHDSES